MKNKISLSTLALTLLINNNITAADEETDLSMMSSLAEILNLNISVGTNIKGLTDRDLPSQITAISREDIKLSGARTLPELLSLYVPGMMAVIDADDVIYGFRGFAPDNNSTVALLVNGQNIGFNANMGSSVTMGILDLNYIERVEIITGPGSSTYGSGPLLGVINVVTADLKDDDESGVAIGYDYGTGQYSDAHLNMQYINDDLLKVSASMAFFQQKQGFDRRSGTTEWQMPAGPDTTYMEHRPGHSFFSLIEKENFKSSLYSNKFMQDKYTGRSGQFVIYESQGGYIQNDFNITEKFSLTPQIAVKRTVQDDTVDINNASSTAIAGEEMYGLKLTSQYTEDRFQVAFGGSLNRFEYGEDPFSGQNAIYHGSLTELFDQQGNSIGEVQGHVPHSGVGEATDWDLFTEFRYELNEDHAISLAGLFAYDDIVDEHNFAPKISYIGKSDSLWWKVFYSEAFRTPIPQSKLDLTPGAFWKHYSNPNLETQKYNDFEIHVGYGQEHYNLEFVSFYSEYDGIHFATAEPTFFDNSKYVWTFINGGDISTYGFELSAALRPTDQIDLRFSHSFVKILDANFAKGLLGELFADRDGDHLLNIPENMTKINFTYKPLAKLATHADLLVDYGRYRSDTTMIVLADGTHQVLPRGVAAKSDVWYNLNLGLVYNHIDDLDFTFHIYNIFDSRPYMPVVHNNSMASTPFPTSFKFGFEYRM